MMMDKPATAKSSTDRRSFLKTGALAAAPLALAAPGAALAADDGAKAKLTRLEDEKAIARLHREIVGEVNGGRRKLATRLSALAADPAHELEIAFAEGGRSATCRRACTASFRTEFTGTTTLEQMHRLQGQGSYNHDEARVLVSEYRRSKDGWAIASVRLA
jgi:hypothetical protein